jgi:hypothetical protein
MRLLAPPRRFATIQADIATAKAQADIAIAKDQTDIAIAQGNVRTVGSAVAIASDGVEAAAAAAAIARASATTSATSTTTAPASTAPAATATAGRHRPVAHRYGRNDRRHLLLQATQPTGAMGTADGLERRPDSRTTARRAERAPYRAH